MRRRARRCRTILFSRNVVPVKRQNMKSCSRYWNFTSPLLSIWKVNLVVGHRVKWKVIINSSSTPFLDCFTYKPDGPLFPSDRLINIVKLFTRLIHHINPASTPVLNMEQKFKVWSNFVGVPVIQFISV